VTKYLSRQDEELERNKQAIESYMTFVRFVKDAKGVKSFTRMLGENKDKFVEVVEVPLWSGMKSSKSASI
jgi:hypothetical protein